MVLMVNNLSGFGGGGSQAAIKSVEYGSYALSGGVITVPYPAGASSGDLVICIQTYSTITTQPTFPSDSFTLIVQTSSAGAAQDNHTASAWYRVLDGTEGSDFTINPPSDPANVAAWTCCISNYLGTPEGSGTSSTAGTDPDPPSITPSWGSSSATRFIVVGTNDGATITVSSYPTNYVDDQQAITGTAPAFAVASRIATSSPENPSGFNTNATTDWVALTIAVRSA